MTNKYIPILLLLTTTLLLCCLFYDTEDTKNTCSNKTVKRIYKPGAIKEKINLDECMGLDTKQINNDTYTKLNGMSIDEAKKYLKNKQKHILSIIPQFPKFPKIWLTPPENKGSYASLGERHCIEFLELIFPNYKFLKVRPT